MEKLLNVEELADFLRLNEKEEVSIIRRGFPVIWVNTLITVGFFKGVAFINFEITEIARGYIPKTAYLRIHYLEAEM